MENDSDEKLTMTFKNKKEVGQWLGTNVVNPRVAPIQ